MSKKKAGKGKAGRGKDKVEIMPEKEEEFDEVHDVEDAKPVRISLHMIAKHHLPKETNNSTEQDVILAGLDKITHLRLDRQNISHMDSLELLGGNVTNVYLQVNRIEKIENLESLVNLRFLTLADNRISHIEGLSHLTKLGFLDLSNNCIKDIDIDELPQSLVILNLKDNPCTQHPDHRGRLIQDLGKLRQLDLVDVSKQERIEAGYSVSSSEEDDGDEQEEEDEKGGGDQNPVDLPAVLQRIRRRVQDRMEASEEEHAERMSILTDLRAKYTPR